jgi:hypothetical protein
MRSTRHTLARLTVLAGLFGAASAGVASSAASASSASTALSTAAPKVLNVPGQVISISQPLPNGTMWVLTSTAGRRTMYQYDLANGTVPGSEDVSPHADAIALSPSGSTVALGTTAGAFPAVLWYSGKTGRFSNAAKATGPVISVAVNTYGDGIFSIRGKTNSRSISALGTLNNLSYNFLVPGNPVDVAVALQGKTLLVLQSNGMLGTLSLPGGAYVNAYSTGAPARAMALSSDGTTLYVLRTPTATGTGSIAVVDVAAGKVTQTISVPSTCVDIALATTGHTLYEALRGSRYSSLRAISVP